MTSENVINSTEKTSENNDIDAKYKLFGWRNLRIGGVMSRPLFAYIILCTCNFVQNFSVNGANNAVISTLERVFYLDSVQSGLFLALYDLATVFSSPLVGYFGSRYSSPIFFSMNMIVVGIGNILIASGNFANQDSGFTFNFRSAENLSIENDVLFQCYKDPFTEQTQSNASCLKGGHQLNTAVNAKLLIYFGNFVNGLGSVALFTIGITYIERIFSHEKAAYCQGIYFAVGTVGSALGIVVTGRFLQLYTTLTPRRRLPHWLTPDHPLWIGCWWLPYIIYGTLCFLIGLFVSGLPNYEKKGAKHPIGKPPQNTASVGRNSIAPDLGIAREDSTTSISMLSSCPPTPALDLSVSKLQFDQSNYGENTLPSLKHLVNEYQLSKRQHRQVIPYETKSSSVDENKTSNSISYVYSIESVYNQKATTHTEPSVTVTNDSLSSTTDTSSSSHFSIRTISRHLKHMCSDIGALIKNTRYICIVIAYLFEGMLIKGFVPFVTKYFEYQHQLDTSTATLITGSIALLSVIIGCPIGAWFLNKFSWTPQQCARICGIIFSISSFLFLFLILSCPELKFESSLCVASNAPCCQNVYYPVCMVTDSHRMFLSPCHYGCMNETIMTNNEASFYSSCNCASDPTVKLTEAACRFRRIPCVPIFALTLSGAALVVFFTAFIQVPLLQVLLYSVPFSHQSMALGLRQTVVRVLGQTTGPLLFGFTFDQACLVWLSDCYSRRTCKVYDNRRMGISMALSGFSTRIISGIACIIVAFHWKTRNPNENTIARNSTTIIQHDVVHENENHKTTKM